MKEVPHASFLSSPGGTSWKAHASSPCVFAQEVETKLYMEDQHRRAMDAWERERAEAQAQHASALEEAQREHEANLERLRVAWEKHVEEVRRRRKRMMRRLMRPSTGRREQTPAVACGRPPALRARRPGR